MDKLIKTLIELRDHVFKVEHGIKHYAVVRNFDGTSFEKFGFKGLPIFRSFTRIGKNRKLGVFHDRTFDMYRDNWMDFPTIIQAELGGEWQEYNKVACVHVGWCNLNCWYCYVEECLRSACFHCIFKETNKCLRKGPITATVTAREVIDPFAEVYEKEGIKVLRVTGGEPFLAPDFIIEICELLREYGLSEKTYVWTETNLTPFLKIPEKDVRVIEFWEETEGNWSWKELCSFKNMAVHACFHGINECSFYHNTGYELSDFNMLIDACGFLLQSKIRVYPTIGAEVSPPEALSDFFHKLCSISEYFPLLIAVRSYDFAYEPILKRVRALLGREQGSFPSFSYLSNKSLIIDLWDALLYQKYKKHYTEIPRERVYNLIEGRSL